MSDGARLLHLVLVRWRRPVDDVAVAGLASAARALSASIPGIRALCEGPSVSPEGLEDGYDWCLAISFDDAHARDGYLPHPEHVVVAQQLGRLAERVIVFDV